MNPEGTRGATADRTLLIRTSCLAVVEELWTLRVPGDVAARVATSDQDALALLDSDFVVSVENTKVDGEHDRSVISVTDPEMQGAGRPPARLDASPGVSGDLSSFSRVAMRRS